MTKPQPDFLYFRDTDIVELFHRVKWSDILYITTKQNHRELFDSVGVCISDASVDGCVGVFQTSG